MTTIPDYITVLAMSHQTHETHVMRAVRSTGIPIRRRIGMWFSRRSEAAAGGASAPALMLPELRDYPYRSGC
jgi:hypothetical protein